MAYTESNSLSRMSRQFGELRTMDAIPDHDPIAEAAHRRRGALVVLTGVLAVASLAVAAERTGLFEDPAVLSGGTEQVGDPIVSGESRAELSEAPEFSRITTDGLVVMQDGTTFVPAEAVDSYLEHED